MPLIIKKKSQSRMVVTHEDGPSGRVKRIYIGTTPTPREKKSNPKPLPEISLKEPGRLRIAHLLRLLGISRTTLYIGIQSGRYPAPDGRDGRMPYWNTETIAHWLSR